MTNIEWTREEKPETETKRVKVSPPKEPPRKKVGKDKKVD